MRLLTRAWAAPEPATCGGVRSDKETMGSCGVGPVSALGAGGHRHGFFEMTHWHELSPSVKSWPCSGFQCRSRADSAASTRAYARQLHARALSHAQPALKPPPDCAPSRHARRHFYGLEFRRPSSIVCRPASRRTAASHPLPPLASSPDRYILTANKLVGPKIVKTNPGQAGAYGGRTAA